MAKIQKLQTRKPSQEELKNYVRVAFDPEALFILFLIETWRQDWNKKWQVPSFVYSAFCWKDSEQGWLFWFQKSKKAGKALKKYRP